VNWVDLLILGALALALMNGYRRGVVIQVFSWGGFILGIVVAALVSPAIVRIFHPHTAASRQIAVLVSFLGVAFVVEALIAIAGSLLARRITAPKLRQIDKAVGCALAGVLALLAAWMLSLPAKGAPSLRSAVKSSAILRAEYAFLHTPPDFMASIITLLNHTGFPEVFAQLNPSLAPGVSAPPASLRNNKAIQASAELTYKIESDGCGPPGSRVDGSGFPADPHVVITAAHVVAGTHGTRVIEPNGTTFRATVVYMDTNTDIAVLRVATLPSRSLSVDPNRAPRGTDGAAIGYPGGGKRQISVARVRTRTEAVGYDIYSSRRISREIYVLRAHVIPGNSGGPFVDTEGRVRGMVFAASSNNPDEAYALDENEIEKALRNGGDRTRSVDTKSCAL
jgi:S1-C subfamily serine protease